MIKLGKSFRESIKGFVISLLFTIETFKSPNYRTLAEFTLRSKKGNRNKQFAWALNNNEDFGESLYQRRTMMSSVGKL